MKAVRRASAWKFPGIIVRATAAAELGKCRCESERVLCVQVVTPGYVRVVKGEGMPKSKQPGQKGDLRIVFDVQVRPGLLN